MRPATLCAYLGTTLFLGLANADCTNQLNGKSCSGNIYGPSSGNDGSFKDVYCCPPSNGQCSMDLSGNTKSCPDGSKGTLLDPSSGGSATSTSAKSEATGAGLSGMVVSGALMGAAWEWLN